MLLSMVYLNFVLISDDLVLFCFDVSLKRKNLLLKVETVPICTVFAVFLQVNLLE